MQPCKTCGRSGSPKGNLNMGYHTYIKIINNDKFEEHHLSTYLDDCSVCAKEKVNQWKVLNNVKHKAYPKQFWINLYPEYSDIITNRESGKGSLQYYILSGKTEDDWKHKNSKLSVGYEVLKNKGLTEQQIKDIKDKHSAKSKLTLERCIERYGLVEGELKYKSIIENLINTSCRKVSTYLNQGYSLEDAGLKVKKVQTRDLNFFVKKYGEVEAVKHWEIYCYSRGRTIEQFTKQYGEERTIEICKSKGRTYEDLVLLHGQEKADDIIRRKTSYFHNMTGSANSNIQKEFAVNLYSELPEQLQQKFIGVPITNNSFMISLNSNDKQIINQKVIVPDIRLGNLIIEFDGVFWHSLSENNDKLKEEVLANKGFTVIRVTDKEYMLDKVKTVNLTSLRVQQLYNPEFHFTHYK